jgi:hypothetical protein
MVLVTDLTNRNPRLFDGEGVWPHSLGAKGEVLGLADQLKCATHERAVSVGEKDLGM